MWYLYILECSDGSFYTGITKYPAKRFKAHEQGKGSKYVRSRLPFKVQYISYFYSKNNALKEEVAVKKLTATGKINWMRGISKEEFVSILKKAKVPQKLWGDFDKYRSEI